jgi:C-terminal processing protease CtpA/Prc
LEKTADAIEQNYVFPEKGRQIAERLRMKTKAGGYSQKDSKELADAVNADLIQWSDRDRHLWLDYEKGGWSKSKVKDPAELLAKVSQQMPLFGNGIVDVRRLPGNIGYLRIDSLLPSVTFTDTLRSAVRLLQNTYGLILDLRACGGGEPAVTAKAASFFLSRGRVPVSTVRVRWEGGIPRRIESIVRGMENTYSTDLGKDSYGESRPVYLLTSGDTFSGCEELAYDLKAFKRVRLFGQTTKGGAHAGWFEPLNDDFAVYVAWGEVINPITKTNWERKGVSPDQATDVDSIFPSAYRALLKATQAARKDPDLVSEADAAEQKPPVIEVRKQ